jgi:hypothetical protein
MKVPLLLISFVLFLTANAQKVEFGLSIQGGLSTLSTKQSSIQSFNSNQGIPSKSDWVHATTWSTKQIDLKLYLSRPKNLSISLGIRTFRYRWEVDSIGISVYSGSVNPPTGSWESYYARQTNVREYMIPTIGLGYDMKITNKLWLNSSLSFGVTSFVNFVKINSDAYGGGQDAFDYRDNGFKDGSYSSYLFKDVADLQVQSVLAYNYKYLYLYAGPSLYFLKTSSMRYFGLHFNAGIAFRFKRDDM